MLKDFKPRYEVIKGKEKLVEELKEAADKSDEIFLATDPDWRRRSHFVAFGLFHWDWMWKIITGVTFNEITKTAVTNGIEHPRAIDMDLVNAQQARRNFRPFGGL